MKTLGERLKYLRTIEGISLHDLANRITKILHSDSSFFLKSTTSATLSNIENDKNRPTSDLIIAISKHFDVSNDWLLTGYEFQGVRTETSQEDMKKYEEDLNEAMEVLEKAMIKFKTRPN